MRLIRAIQRSAVLLTLAFSFAALAVLPTALCCQALSTQAAHGTDERCPHATEEGTACPLHQSQPASADGPMLTSCSTDGLLHSLLTLTGALPVPRAQTGIAFAYHGVPIPLDITAPSVPRPPHAPPPRR